jgi:murein DD-endopeptidase MepM/ murein hydrolase activator NlpD
MVFSIMHGVGETAYYPVYPWTKVPKVTQDAGCVGVENISPAKEQSWSKTRQRYEAFDTCYLPDKIHDGADFVPDSSVPNVKGEDEYEVRAVASGTVMFADGTKNCSTNKPDCNYGFGNIVVVKRDDGLYEGYAHLEPKKVYVSKNDRVSPGKPLGRMGKTGIVTAVHLHYVVWNVDPKFSSSGSKPAVVVKYKDSHPANFNIIDPWTVLATPHESFLMVEASSVNIHRGPDVKYSVFAQGQYLNAFIAFVYAYADDMFWYRVHLPCSSESSCAGWIKESDVTAYKILANDPYVVRINAGTGKVTVRSGSSATPSTKLSPIGQIGDTQIFAHLRKLKGDNKTCSCWFEIDKPKWIKNKSFSAWICGGTPSLGNWTTSSCSTNSALGNITLATERRDGIGGNPEDGDYPAPSPNPEPPIPSPPGSFTLSLDSLVCEGGSPKIALSWGSAKDAASYMVERALKGSTTVQQFHLDSPLATTLTTQALSADHTYEWTVVASNNQGTTRSNTVETVVPADICPLPPSVAMTAADVAETRAVVTLAVNTYGRPGNVWVTYGRNSTNKDLVSAKVVVTASQGSQSVTVELSGLACETYYYTASFAETEIGKREGTGYSFKTAACSASSLPFDDGARIDALPPPPQGYVVVFEDAFAATLDASRWQNKNTGGLASNGSTLKLSEGGSVESLPFAINPKLPLTFLRRVRVHDGVPPMRFSIGIGGNSGAFGLYYGTGCMGMYRDNSNLERTCDYGSVSSSITFPDRVWMTERVEFDPVTGALRYFRDDVELLSYSTSPLSPLMTQSALFLHSGNGPFGQYQETDYIRILQPKGEDNGAVVPPTPGRQRVAGDTFENGVPDASFWVTMVNAAPWDVDKRYTAVSSHTSVGTMESIPLPVNLTKPWEIRWRMYLIAAPGNYCTQYIELAANTGQRYGVAFQQGDWKPDDRCPLNPGYNVIGYLTGNRSCEEGKRTQQFDFVNRIWVDNTLAYDPVSGDLVYLLNGVEQRRLPASALAYANTITLKFSSGLDHRDGPNGQTFVLDEVGVWQ